MLIITLYGLFKNNVHHSLKQWETLFSKNFLPFLDYLDIIVLGKMRNESRQTLTCTTCEHLDRILNF